MIGIFRFIPSRRFDLITTENGIKTDLLAAIGWGIYTISGKSSKNPLITTMSNFIFTLPIIFLI